MTATTLSRNCSASLALLLFVTPIVHGWVTNNFRGVTTNPNRICSVNNDKSLPRYVCPAISSPTSLFATTVEEEEEEVIEYLDDDDEDEEDDSNYDPKAALAQQAEWMMELQRLSETTSSDPSAVAEAQEIFDEMFTAYVESDDATFFPTVEVYNLVLETHAYSQSEDKGAEAERILGRMEDQSNDFVARPNEETYLCVMDAWAMTGQPDKAKAVLDRQEAPTTNAYNKMIKAYGIAGDFEKAESTFRSLLSDGKANQKSWVQLMKARASCEDDDDLQETVESYFEEMEEEGVEPETDAFNVLIRSIRKTPEGPQRAEAMLFKMIERFRQGEEQVKPNSETFRAVLTAYNGRGKKFTTRSIAAKVEQIMQIREGLLSKEESGSDERIYRIALGIVSRSKDSKKAVRANRMFQKYNGATLYLNYLILKACAYTDGNYEEKFEAFHIALEILKDLRSSPELEIDSSITGMFIKACSNLMPAGPKRDFAVKKVFQECCTQGLVNDFVLNGFELASSEALQLEILGGFSVDGVSVPDSWSRNVVA